MSYADYGIRSAIPPYMFKRIELEGPEELRGIASAMLERSESFRTERYSIETQLASGILTRPFQAISEPTNVNRRIYDAGGAESLPGTLARGEDDPATGDPAVDEAYDCAGLTYFFLRDEYGRNSVDDRGMSLDSTVHYGSRFNNAFWNGRQMVYGDGDDVLFTRFTKDLSIVAHELGHGVVQYEANLDYEFQSGALNESYADVIGSMVYQRSYGQTAREADWLIGREVMVGDQYAMRSMKAPGTGYLNHPILGDDPQPATMDDYLNLPMYDDRGGVHLNSGIPNHAFYVTAVELGGNAWERAGRIWYLALCNRLSRDDDFLTAATKLVQVARDEFGAGSVEEKAVQKGWKEVKVFH